MPAHRVWAPAPRARHGRRHDPAGGGHQRARGRLRQGLLRRPGDRRAPPLQGQAEPPPARPAPVRAGRAGRRDPARREGRSAGSARRASRRGSARSPWPWSGARRPPATRCWWTARRRGSPSCPSSVAEPRTPTSRHGLSRESPLLGYDPHAGAPDHAAPSRAPLDLPPEPPPRRAARPARAGPARRPGRQLDDWGRSRARLRLPRAGARLLLPVLVPGRDGGRGERARRGRRAARVEPLRRAAARTRR